MLCVDDIMHIDFLQNRIRQALFPEYYNVFNNPDDPDRNMHIGKLMRDLQPPDLLIAEKGTASITFVKQYSAMLILRQWNGYTLAIR